MENGHICVQDCISWTSSVIKAKNLECPSIKGNLWTCTCENCWLRTGRMRGSNNSPVTLPFSVVMPFSSLWYKVAATCASPHPLSSPHQDSRGSRGITWNWVPCLTLNRGWWLSAFGALAGQACVSWHRRGSQRENGCHPI